MQQLVEKAGADGLTVYRYFDVRPAVAPGCGQFPRCFCLCLRHTFSAIMMDVHVVVFDLEVTADVHKRTTLQ